MNWKRLYEGFKKGDKVKMIKPCTRCGSTGKNRRTICWDVSFKDRELICLGDEYENGGIIYVDIQVTEEGKSDNCTVPKECLVKIL